MEGNRTLNSNTELHPGYLEYLGNGKLIDLKLSNDYTFSMGPTSEQLQLRVAHLRSDLWSPEEIFQPSGCGSRTQCNDSSENEEEQVPSVLKFSFGAFGKVRDQPRPLPHPCDHCDQRFKLQWDLDVHLMDVHSIDPYHTCDKCSRVYTRIEDFERHQITHGERRFKCTTCKLDFLRQKTLKRHIKSHHKLEEKKETKCDAERMLETNHGGSVAPTNDVQLSPSVSIAQANLALNQDKENKTAIVKQDPEVTTNVNAAYESESLETISISEVPKLNTRTRIFYNQSRLRHK